MCPLVSPFCCNGMEMLLNVHTSEWPCFLCSLWRCFCGSGLVHLCCLTYCLGTGYHGLWFVIWCICLSESGAVLYCLRVLYLGTSASGTSCKPCKVVCAIAIETFFPLGWTISSWLCVSTSCAFYVGCCGILIHR